MSEREVPANVSISRNSNNEVCIKIADELHPHLFRHTFASWHIMNGTSLPELKELGGWAKLESVLIYAHLNLDHLQQSSEKIQEALRV